MLLLQRWPHDADAWDALPVARQEAIIGRTKADSAELDDKQSTSHVSRTDQDRFGKVFRRNMPYGTVTSHGTMFVGFSAEQRRLATMLDSMAGVLDGVRDALTYYTRPVTGAYYFVPSTPMLQRHSTDPRSRSREVPADVEQCQPAAASATSRTPPSAGARSPMPNAPARLRGSR